jgi:large subunit ribosomal protein L6
MSRVGKKPIEIPSGVQVNMAGQEVRVQGPRGELVRVLHSDVRVAKDEKEIVVTPVGGLGKKREKQARALWGLTRTLISNMVEGVTKGYEKKLEIEGTGFRALVEGDGLALSLGFSHPVKLMFPKGISCSVEKNVITVAGPDKEQVGEFAARIRRLRPVEPYKGKGVRYQGEYVRRKEGKKAAGAAGATA